MSRRIIVMADGTGNSAVSATKTNVWRLYEALDLTGEDQIARFDDGVGTSSLKPLRYLGLALGIGVKRNVLDLYKFICRTYRPADEATGRPGDLIYAFGFSRGAFTIRVLNGLIGRKGLALYVSDEQLDHDAIAAYRAYRKEAFHPTLPARLLRGMRDWLLRERDNITGRRYDSRSLTARATALWHRMWGKPQPLPAAEVPGNFIIGVRVHFVGVWDTVAAYGLPIDELSRAVDKWVWPMEFGKALLGHVNCTRHALALDDERRTFFPIPWRQERWARDYGDDVHDEKLLQVWFAGVHANVGGGYADDRLAHVSLLWMIGEAARSSDALPGAVARVGLRFRPEVVERYRAILSDHGRIYDSRAGLGTLYRYHPRSLAELMKLGTAPDPDRDSVPLIHDSVILRMAEGADHYAPVSIDTAIDVLAEDGTLLPFRTTEAPPAGADRTSHVMRAINALIDGSRRGQREYCRQRGLDLVWWRRVFYYVMLGLVILLVAFPLVKLAAAEPIRAVFDAIQGWSQNLGDNVAGFVLSPAFFALRFGLAGQADTWVDAYESEPFAAGLLGLVLWWLYSMADTFQKRIHDWTSAAWNSERRALVQNVDREQHAAQKRFSRLLPVIVGVAALLVLGCTILWPGTLLRVLWLLAGATVLVGALFALTIAIVAVLFAAGYAYSWLSRVSGVRPRLSPAERSVPASMPPWRLLKLARWSRETPHLVAAYEAIKYPILPFLALVATAAALLWLPAARLYNDVNMWTGRYCEGPAVATLIEGERTERFATDQFCWASGALLKAGTRYQITLKIPDDGSDWFDRSEHSDVGGFPSREAFRRFFAVTKRSWSNYWFAPIGRIGSGGDTEFSFVPNPERLSASPLSPTAERQLRDLWDSDANRGSSLDPIKPKTAEKATAIYAANGARGARSASATIVAAKTGELFLYVNDSVSLFPGVGFYHNNTGVADVTIKPLPPESR